MKRAIILYCDDWEGVYVDGQLIDEGHTIEEGDRFYWVKFMKEHDLSIDDFCKPSGLSSLDEDIVNNTGSFPSDINEFYSHELYLKQQ